MSLRSSFGAGNCPRSPFLRPFLTSVLSLSWQNIVIHLKSREKEGELHMENRAPYARRHNKDLGGPNLLSRNDRFSATENTCSVFLFAVS